MTCPVLRFLPELAWIAEHLDRSPVTRWYLRALVKDLCDECRHRSPRRGCPLGDLPDSQETSYLPRVLEAVEEACGFGETCKT